MPAVWGQDRGATLNTFLGNTAVIPIEAPKKKWSLLPLLTVLFLISYGLMTMLIIEQGATIQSQRNLILELFRDSTELSSMKGKALHEKQMAQGQNHAQVPSSQAQRPLTRTPSTQTPSTQAPSTQAPSSQVATPPHSQSRANKSVKPDIKAPSKPAADLGDDRRALITI